MPADESDVVLLAVGSKPNLTVAIQTITTAGFILDRVDREPRCALIFAHRPDEFGTPHHYCFALAESNSLRRREIDAITIPAKQHDASLVLIAANADGDPCFEWSRFVGMFGGAVFSTSPLEPEFTSQLISLGRNELPVGLVGRADDLFEAYVRIALEFILGVRVIRYGQDRRFEARPDGLILPYNKFAALYDSKAYGEGYEVTLESIRQFESYVNDFQHRYESYFPRLNTFIVISTSFPHKDETLKARSADLLAKCNVPLSFLTSTALANIVTQISQFPSARKSIDWKRVFADQIVDPNRVAKELAAIEKDGIVHKQ